MRLRRAWVLYVFVIDARPSSLLVSSPMVIIWSASPGNGVVSPRARATLEIFLDLPDGAASIPSRIALFPLILPGHDVGAETIGMLPDKSD